MVLLASAPIPGASFGTVPIPGRLLDPGMGVAVGRRTIFRPEDQEDFGRVADRVARGNLSLGGGAAEEGAYLRNAIACGALLTAGRHLQQGDSAQKERHAEVYVNCATAATSFALFMLLLCGSGVGRSYDDDMLLVDWTKAPRLFIHLSPEHPDSWERNPAFFASEFDCGSDEEAARLFHARTFLSEPDCSEGIVRHVVQDSREGWAKAVEIYETMAYEQESRCLFLDFSQVRRAGSPIAGMQGRPASGPLSLIRAFLNIRSQVVEAGFKPLWEQAMRVDHALSTEVQVGGARRAARMSTKSWRDPDIMEFIRIKSRGGLWTSNNSVMVDTDFWTQVHAGGYTACMVFDEITACMHENGEPGFINVDLLEDERTGSSRQFSHLRRRIGSRRYPVTYAQRLVQHLVQKASVARNVTITNPCGEQGLSVLGGFCTLADVAPVLAAPFDFINPHGFPLWEENAAAWDDRSEDAVRLAARFLIRVNTMDSFYPGETARTNRIGVGLTGLHEYAWVRFGLTFRQLLNESRSYDFWAMIRRLSNAAKDEANRYSESLGLARPVTVTTAKPSGSVSKLFALTEGVHLLAKAFYLRWVQFKGVWENGEWAVGSDPLLEDYRRRGYPLKALRTFPGMTAVGFPTAPLLSRLGLGEALVTASEATPEEHYQWLRLLEKYWLGESQGAQLSYTLKVYTDRCNLEQFRKIVLHEQPTVRCCAVMPTKPDAALNYEYLPEELISESEFRQIVERIDDADREEIDLEHLRCEAGVCPI